MINQWAVGKNGNHCHYQRNSCGNWSPWRLSNTDHRFKAVWKKGLSSDMWLGDMRNETFSKTFTSTNWEDSLRCVHANAWEKWQIGKDDLPDLVLEHGASPQRPGVISQDVILAMRPIMENIPEKKVYKKSK